MATADPYDLDPSEVYGDEDPEAVVVGVDYRRITEPGQGSAASFEAFQAQLAEQEASHGLAARDTPEVSASTVGGEHSTIFQARRRDLTADESRQRDFLVQAEIREAKDESRRRDFLADESRRRDVLVQAEIREAEDESRRRDVLVQAEIREAKLAPLRSLLVVILSMLGCFYSMAFFDNTLVALGFLALPIFIYTAELLKHLVDSKSGRANHAQERTW